MGALGLRRCISFEHGDVIPAIRYVIVYQSEGLVGFLWWFLATVFDNSEYESILIWGILKIRYILYNYIPCTLMFYIYNHTDLYCFTCSNPSSQKDPSKAIYLRRLYPYQNMTGQTMRQLSSVTNLQGPKLLGQQKGLYPMTHPWDWHIYLHEWVFFMVYKCRQIYHTWILWDSTFYYREYSLKQFAPEHGPGPKRKPDRIPTIHFQVRFFGFRDCTFYYREYIRLKFQKSQGQPPGMYKTL